MRITKTLIVFLLSLAVESEGGWAGLTPDGVIQADSSGIIDYTAINPDGQKTLFLLATSSGKSTKIDIYNDHNSICQTVSLNGNGFSRLRCFNFHNNIYIYLDELYCLVPDQAVAQKIPLSGKNYRYLQLICGSTDTLLLASSRELIHLYSIPDFKLTHEIKRTDYLQFDIPLIYGQNLIYRDRVNELKIYDLEYRKNINIFNTGQQSAYFLGIKIGDFDDRISWYHLQGKYLYFTTFSGAIYKVDPILGSVINHTPRFMGLANNAGLITCFNMSDIDRDGVPDLIGPSVDQNIYCLSGKDFAPLWIYDTGFEIQMPLSLFDLTNDHIPDIIGVTDAMKLCILDGRDGNLLFEHHLSGQQFQTSAGILDVDYDNIPELVVKRNWATIEIFEFDSLSVNKGEIIWLPLF